MEKVGLGDWRGRPDRGSPTHPLQDNLLVLEHAVAAIHLGGGERSSRGTETKDIPLACLVCGAQGAKDQL